MLGLSLTICFGLGLGDPKIGHELPIGLYPASSNRTDLFGFSTLAPYDLARPRHSRSARYMCRAPFRLSANSRLLSGEYCCEPRDLHRTHAPRLAPEMSSFSLPIPRRFRHSCGCGVSSHGVADLRHIRRASWQWSFLNKAVVNLRERHPGGQTYSLHRARSLAQPRSWSDSPTPSDLEKYVRPPRQTRFASRRRRRAWRKPR